MMVIQLKSIEFSLLMWRLKSTSAYYRASTVKQNTEKYKYTQN